MPIRIPQNQIKYQYTAGKEYMLESNYREYQGYYYELKGKTFAGKEFNSNAPVLIKINSSNVNTLLTNASTYAYARISGIKINTSTPPSFIYRYESDTRYFIYNVSKKIIKEISKETFDIFQSNPLYISVELNFTTGFNDQELNEAEKKIPGIKEFVNTSYTPPPVEESGEIG